MTAYPELERRFHRLSVLGEVSGMLDWDRSVIMPSGGAAARTDQLTELSLLRHEMLTDAALPELMDSAATAGGLDRWQQANLREMLRSWVHANALDADLVAALTRATSDCEMTWRTARADSDFAAITPSLKEVLALTREKARAVAEALGVSPYEALMDAFEPGMTTRRIDVLFNELADFLPDFTEQVLARQAAHPEPIAPTGPFDIDVQRALGLEIMAELGFDFDHGRLDVSVHPFCGGVPDDVRITTRYDADNFAESLMGVLHETGHGMYEAGLPAKWRYQPVGMARGMALHESQSLLFEMQACRSRAFMGFLAPRARAAFGGEGNAWSDDAFYARYTRVEPGFIRVDADEVTYPAHVILRYRLEHAMIAGMLEVEDLPAAWNEGMESLLGICPPDDRRGCLQDVHWFDGAWGYFPTYTLGALAAAQIFQAAEAALAGLWDDIGRGDFSALTGWLGTHIHQQGSSASTDEILEEATGAPLGIAAYKAHITARYLG